MNYKLFLSLLFYIGITLSGFCEKPGLAIKNITFYPAPFQKPVEQATILIKNNKIQEILTSNNIEIPENYRIVDSSDKYAVAGFWNNHIHLTEEKWLYAKNKPRKTEKNLKEILTSWGFVYAFDLTQFDINNLNIIRKLIADKTIVGPTIFSVGVPFTSQNPFYIEPHKLPELHECFAINEHIQNQIQNGAEGIKLWSGSPIKDEVKYMKNNLIKTAAKLTKEKGLPLFSHPTDNKGVKIAVENGVSILTHTSPTSYKNWDSSLVERMIANNVALIPTLKLFVWELEKEGVSKTNHPLIITAQKQLSTYQKADGQILFGTDVGYMTDYNPADEYALMQQSGLTFDEILASLTIHPAKRFGYALSKGKIEPGYDADIVILNKNPQKNIQHLSNVSMSIHKGQIIYSSEEADY